MALERKAYCEQRIKEYKEALEAGTTGYERNVARANARNWELKLQEVEAFLDGREIDYDL